MFLKGLAGEIEAHAFACGRACAVAGDEVVDVQRVFAIGRVDGQLNVIAFVVVVDHVVLEAQVDMVREIAGAVDQIFFNVVLLQVDEGGVFVAVFGEKVEIEHFLVAVKLAADFPGDAFFQHPFAHALPVKDFQRALGPADRAGADGDDVVVIQHHGFDTTLGQLDRHREADGACADNANGMAGLGGGQSRWGDVFKGGVVVSHGLPS